MNKADEEAVLSLGLYIRKLRNDLGFSQESFADATSLDRTYISGLERGKRNPSYLTLTKIAKTLNMSVSELLSKGERNGSC